MVKAEWVLTVMTLLLIVEHNFIMIRYHPIYCSTFTYVLFAHYLVSSFIPSPFLSRKRHQDFLPPHLLTYHNKRRTPPKKYTVVHVPYVGTWYVVLSK